MTNIELGALRRLLFFPRDEAAALVGGGVSLRAWNHWEAGDRPVPDDVADMLRKLCAWREQAISAYLGAIAQAREKLGEPQEVALVWYVTVEDWMTLPDREPFLWRPHCSLVAHILAAEPAVRLVPFDSAAYAAWLGRRKDSEAMRGEWAASTLDDGT